MANLNRYRKQGLNESVEIPDLVLEYTNWATQDGTEPKDECFGIEGSVKEFLENYHEDNMDLLSELMTAINKTNLNESMSKFSKYKNLNESTNYKVTAEQALEAITKLGVKARLTDLMGEGDMVIVIDDMTDKYEGKGSKLAKEAGLSGMWKLRWEERIETTFMLPTKENKISKGEMNESSNKKYYNLSESNDYATDWDEMSAGDKESSLDWIGGDLSLKDSNWEDLPEKIKKRLQQSIGLNEDASINPHGSSLIFSKVGDEHLLVITNLLADAVSEGQNGGEINAQYLDCLAEIQKRKLNLNESGNADYFVETFNIFNVKAEVAFDKHGNILSINWAGTPIFFSNLQVDARNEVKRQVNEYINKLKPLNESVNLEEITEAQKMFENKSALSKGDLARVLTINSVAGRVFKESDISDAVLSKFNAGWSSIHSKNSGFDYFGDDVEPEDSDVFDEFMDLIASLQSVDSKVSLFENAGSVKASIVGLNERRASVYSSMFSKINSKISNCQSKDLSVLNEQAKNIKNKIKDFERVTGSKVSLNNKTKDLPF